MTILITGTTNGIGFATARKLYSRGHNIIMVNRNAGRAEAVKNEFENEINSGAEIFSYIADFADLESVKDVCIDITAHFSSIDVLINNAGLFCDSHMETAQHLEMTIGVNYFAPVLFTRGVLPLLATTERGRILNVSSRAGLFGKIRRKKFFKPSHPHGFQAYSASKLAVILWSRTLAEELEGIDVISVHPGEVASNIWTGDSFFMRMMAPIVRKKYQTIEEGAATSINLALMNDVSHLSGCFVEKHDQIIPYNKKCSDERLKNWLYTETEKLVSEFDD